MIQLIDLRKKFDGKLITKGVNLTIEDGTMTCIIGRSGEGKSILLKQIIGLIEPTSGQVLIDGQDTTKLSEHDRNKLLEHFGYVFQFAALLDSLNVFENIGIKLLENGHSARQVLPIVKEKLAMVHLAEDTLYKYPSELSGGMRKRVGLARTLITNPKVVLYDEPTTGLDPITSRVIQELMFDMQQRFNLTSIVVTHDVNSFQYADRVALLHEGKIEHVCDAKTIWESTDPYLYQFIRGLAQGPIQTEIPHDRDLF
jgi:phospholipid/cholesterol/gamma-HCH transport system ATP-binding protein